MMSINLFMLLAIPIGLVIAAGAPIRGRGNPDTAGRRFFLFLVWTSVGLLAAILIINWLTLGPSYGFVSPRIEARKPPPSGLTLTHIFALWYDGGRVVP